MYKLILIDDEEFILKNIAESVNWNKLGFQLAGTFFNAPDALAYIKDHKTDAIITDIKMPHMTGVELAKIIHESYPLIIIVLLSGYSDFKYAKEAIRYNVLEYLEKPVNFEVLEAVCERIRAKLDSYLKDEFYLLGPEEIKLQKVMCDFLYGKTHSPAELHKALNYAGFQIDFENFPAALLQIEIEDLEEYLNNTWKYGKERLYNALNHLMRSSDILYIPTNYLFDNIDIVAVNRNADVFAFKAELIDFQNTFISNCFEILNLQVSVTINRIVPRICLLNKQNTFSKLADIQARSIISLITSGNTEKSVALLIDSINGNDNHDFLILLAEEIIIKLSSTISAENSCLFQTIPNKYSDISNSDELKQYLIAAVQNSANYFSEMLTSRYDVVTAAKEYIANHYMEDITLENISAFVSLSPSYFSKYFRKEAGEKFIDYLNSIRINAAKELLINSRFKVNEIYSMVGYRSLTYFYKIFKLHTGYTAQEYRDKYTK